jgi:hypothetical protein
MGYTHTLDVSCKPEHGAVHACLIPESVTLNPEFLYSFFVAYSECHPSKKGTRHQSSARQALASAHNGAASGARRKPPGVRITAEFRLGGTILLKGPTDEEVCLWWWWGESGRSGDEEVSDGSRV